MKQKSGGIRRLMEFTGKHRGLLTVARILSGISSVFILGPFLCVYFAARDLVGVFAGTALSTAGLVNTGLGSGTDWSGALFCCAALLSCGGISYGKEPKDGSIETFGENAHGLLRCQPQWQAAENY